MKTKLITSFLITLLIQQIAFGQLRTYDVEKAKLSSNKYDEFSPVYYKNGLVFCTNRSEGIKTYSDSKDKSPFKINYIDLDKKLIWQDAELFSKELTTRLNDGPVSFNRNGDTIYFSRNLNVDGRISEIGGARNKLGVFSAVLLNGKWSKVRDLRFNLEWYNITTPWLSPDGQRLYFASDKPDGIGGFDLYYCQWKTDYWDNPVNLGPLVNTTGNEAYPFVNSEGGLFFSSDGHEGMGGKDIFYTKQAGSSWLPPVALDPPINSKYDDFAFIADSVMDEGYFSSKRGSSIDIYHYKTNIHQVFYSNEQRTNEYCFRFSESDKILIDEKYSIDEKYVKYEWSFGDGKIEQGLKVEHCFTGPGKYPVRLDVVEKNSGRLYFTKLSYDLELKDIEQPIINCPETAVAGDSVSFDGLESFFPGSEILKYTWYFGDGSRTSGPKVRHAFETAGKYDIRLGLIVRNLVSGKIFEAGSSIRLNVFGTHIEKINYEAEQKRVPLVNNIISYDHAFLTNEYSAEKEYNQDVVFQVEILSSKNKMGTDNSFFANVPKEYVVKEVLERKDNTYSYIIAEEMNLMDLYPAYNKILDLGFKDSRIKPFILDDQAARDLYNLKKVLGVSADDLFRAGESNLASAGTQLLDLFIGFMAKYTTLKLELAVHTDNTGNAGNNIAFSQRRAEAMQNYLVLNGISSLRLIPKGYGGSQPITMNSDEDERKTNRRVDFSIIK